MGWFKRTLDFKVHPCLPGHVQAKHNGFSIIEGPMVKGFEIMYPNGDVRSGLTLCQVLRIVQQS